jgi:hypothetical protein
VVLVVGLSGTNPVHRAGACAYRTTATRTFAAAPTALAAVATSMPSPGFVLDRGRFRTFDAPGARTETVVSGINDQGQQVGGFDPDVDRHLVLAHFL